VKYYKKNMNAKNKTIITILICLVTLMLGLPITAAQDNKDATPLDKWNFPFKMATNLAFESPSVLPHAREQNRALAFGLSIPSFSSALVGVANDQSAKKTQAADSSASKPSLAEQATNPTAPLVQFRMQNTFIPETFDSTGYSNAAEIQTLIP
jgi:hypothetical protein